LSVAAAMCFAAWATGAGPAAGEELKDYRPYPCLKSQNCALGATYDETGNTNEQQVYVISYGTEATTYQVMVSGRKAAHVCDTILGWDVAGQTVSQCQVQPILLPAKTNGFELCTLTNGACSPPPSASQHKFRVARFGVGIAAGAASSDEKWMYQYVSSSFPCKADDFVGVNAAAVNGSGARCEYSEPVEAAPGAVWTTCAAENATCRFPASGSYLVRFGARLPDDFFYRVISGSQVNCTNAAFKGDPASGFTKRCDYLELPKIASVSGAWEVVGMCEGCSDVTYNLVTGVTQGNEKSSASAWSFELGQEVSVSADVGFASVAGTVTAGQTWSGGNAITDSFTKDDETTLTVSCESGKLWQWVTSVQNYCMPNSGSTSDCVTVARSKMFQCLSPDESPRSQPLRSRAR